MNPRLIPVFIFILIAVMAVPVMMRFVKGKKIEPVTLAQLDAGPGRIVRITVEPNSQQTLSLHYHVTADGHTQIEHAFFGTLPRTSPPPSFRLYLAPGADLIGIAQDTAPDRIIILHDFASHESWPMRNVSYKETDPQHLYPYYEDQDAIMARGESLFARLDETLPEAHLQLLRSMGMRPLTLPDAEHASDYKPTAQD